MATISTRINSSGTYLVNGSFDEITTSTIRTTTNTVYASLLDEVTYNTSSPAIKNLLIYTDSFDNAAWGKNAVTILPNTIIAPDGTLTADKIQETAVTTFFAVVQNPTALPSKSYTMSFYAKAGERTQVAVSFTVSTAYVMYNLATGTVTSTSGAYLVGSSITFVGNGWYRCTVSLTSAPSGSNLLYFVIALVNSNSDNYAGTTGFGAYVWGAQLEQNSTTTIYQGIAAANTLVAPGSAKRETSNGTVYVTGSFDEFTGAPVVDSSLTQWLDFGQTSSYSGSGTTVTDLSPTGTASVTLTGSPTFNNIDGGGSEAFNGSTQYGTGSGTPLGLSAYTKSFWFKLTSYGFSNNTVSSQAGGHFCFFSGGDKLFSGHAFWSSYGIFPSVTSFALNTWYHACVTFNTATGMALYVNGVLDSTYVSTSGTSPTNTPVTGTGQVDIANYGTGNLLAGSIGQVMVYNRVLTADEITQNFNALRRRYGI